MTSHGGGRVPVSPLTDQQRRVLVMLSRCAEEGVVPSLRDVGRRLGMHFTRVHQHLVALHRKGWLRTPTADGLHCTHIRD